MRVIWQSERVLWVGWDIVTERALQFKNVNIAYGIDQLSRRYQRIQEKKIRRGILFHRIFVVRDFGLNHNSKEHHHGMDSVFVDGVFILCDKCTFSGKMPRKVCMHSRFYRTVHVSATGSSTSGDTLHYHSSVSIPK